MTGQRQRKARRFLPAVLAMGTLFGAYCLATVGVSGLLMTVTDTAAQARGHGGGGHHGGGHGGGHRGGGMHGGGRGGHVVHGGGRGGHVVHGGGRGGHVVVRGGGRVGPRGAYRVGGRYYGGIWYGHARRWYGGRWWPYGVGSCWRLSPIGYVWVCG